MDDGQAGGEVVLVSGGILSLSEEAGRTYRAIAQQMEAVGEAIARPDLIPWGTSLAALLLQRDPACFARGQLTVWVAGILSAIAPYYTPVPALSVLSAACGVSESAIRRRCIQVRDRLAQASLDALLTAPPPISPPVAPASQVSVNGLAVDVDLLPPRLKNQALRQGLVPE